MKLLVWGLGRQCDEWIINGNENFVLDEYLIGGIDANASKRSGNIRGKKIYSPEEIVSKKIDFDFILTGSFICGFSIYRHAKQLGLEKKLLPYDVWYFRINNWFNDSIQNFFDKATFQIIKGWHTVVNEESEKQNFIFSINNSAVYTVTLRILPYGCFGKNFKPSKLVISSLTEGILYDMILQRDNLLEIHVHSDIDIIKIEMEGRNRAFIIPQITEDNLEKETVFFDSNEQKTKYRSQVSEIADIVFHEEDYCFLKYFKEYKNYTILDIGANMGVSSMTFLKQTYMNVVAFEPNPLLTKTLNITAELYGSKRLQVIPKGVGAESGKLTFWIPKSSKGWTQEASFIKENAIDSVARFSKSTKTDESDLLSVTVPVIAVDELETEFPVFFIKIDVEGFEMESVRGMKETIIRDNPILLLEDSSPQKRHEIIEYVKSFAAYDLYYWDFLDMHFYKENRRGGINYFLLPQKSGTSELQSVLENLKAE